MDNKTFYTIIIAFSSAVLLLLIILIGIKLFVLKDTLINNNSHKQIEETTTPNVGDESLKGEEELKEEIAETTNDRADTVGGKKQIPEDVTYIPYKNERYKFSLEYPDIFTSKILSDNGDGITLTNSETNIGFWAYASNNIMGDTAQGLHAVDVANASKILYERQKDNWAVISWEDGNEAFYKKTVVGREAINTFIMSYPREQDDEYGVLIDHIFSTFKTPAVDKRN